MHRADMVLDGDAGEIPDFLPQAGEAVIKSGLAGIGRANDRNGPKGCRDAFVFGARHRMTTHCRASVELITERRCADQRHVNVPRELAANGHFGPFDPIHPGISTRATALDGHFESGYKSQVHQVLGDRMVQLQLADDGPFADLEIGERSRGGAALPLAPEYEVENHFQFHFYSNPFRPSGNDQSHTYL